jgi:hypothetical protein
VNGLTNESENALPMDDSFWQHTEHLDFDIIIQLSSQKHLNILHALHDVYDAIDKDPEEAKFLVTGIAALMLSSKYGKTDEVFNDIVVQVAKKDMDMELRELLNEGLE